MLGLLDEEGGSAEGSGRIRGLVERLLSGRSRLPRGEVEATIKGRFAAFVGSNAFGVVARALCVLSAVAVLLIQVPYYPVGIALLFGLALAGLSLRYPRSALVVGVVLSIPSMAHQGGGAWVVYALLSLLLMATILDHWLTGFLTLSSIILALSPLGVLSPLPLLMAGLLLRPSSGAKAGLAASLLIAFLALCWDRSTAGFFYVGSDSLNAFYDASSRPLLGLASRIEDFRPLSIYDAFDEACFSRLDACGRDIAAILLGFGRSYSIETALWAETAVWAASGYLAGKAVYWFRRLRLLPHPVMPAAFISSVLFVVGASFYGHTDLIRSSFLVTVVFLMSIFIGHVGFEVELGRLRSIVAEVRSDLDLLETSVNKAEGEGVNVSTHRGVLEGLTSRLDGVLVFQEGMIEDAGRELQDLQSRVKEAQGGLMEDLEAVRCVDSSLEEAEAGLEGAEELIRRIEGMYADPSLPRSQGDLIRIRSEVEEVRGLLGTGDSKRACRKARGLLSRCRGLEDELGLRILLWEEWLPRRSTIKRLLESRGRITAESLVDIPVQLRRDALGRYWEENRDTTIMEGDALIVKAPEVVRERITCKACGSRIPGGSVYCIRCGQRVEEVMEPLEGEKVSMEERLKPKVEAVTYDLDLMVLNYVVEHKGTISLSRAAENLGITVKELEESIERLKRTGRLA